MERRSFSKYEQDTIKTIVEKAGNSVDYLLVNVYNDIFLYTNVEYYNNELHFFYKKDEFASVDSTSTLTVKRDVIIKTILLKYLVDNGYIYLVEMANVQNESRDIHLGNIRDTEYDMSVDIPADIAKFLNNSKRVVIVSEELKTLVADDFQSPEEKLLKAAERQIKKISTQTLQLEAQRQATMQLVEAAQFQTQETQKQTKLAAKQSKEALSQTKEAQKQTEEALRQTSEAKMQTDEALKQTKEAQKQTCMNIVMGILTLGALICAVITVVLTKTQTSNSIEFNGKSLQQQTIADSINYQHIQSIDRNVQGIKQSTDTILQFKKVPQRKLEGHPQKHKSK